MPGPSTSVMGLDDEKSHRELSQRGPLLCSPSDPFDKFEQDFQATNLPEGKYIQPPPSTAKWYKVGQPFCEDKIQELNMDMQKPVLLLTYMPRQILGPYTPEGPIYYG